MDHLVNTGTQTDPVVILSFAQAATLGLVSQNGPFNFPFRENGIYHMPDASINKNTVLEHMTTEQSPGLDEIHTSECFEQQEDESLEVENGFIPFERQARRRKRQPVKLVHTEKNDENCKEETVEVEYDAENQSNSVLSSSVLYRNGIKMIDISNFKRKQMHRPLRERTLGVQTVSFPPNYKENLHCNSADQQEKVGTEGEKLLSSYFETHTSPTLGQMEEQFQEESVAEANRNFVWQGQVAYEAEMTIPQQEDRNRRAQIDRLDINVQIDDSYCIDVGEGQKRWQCRLCEKSYTSKYNLVTHILGHSGIKPHECQHCHKLFKQPSHLQMHLLTHEGIRPHKCEVCDKAFTQTSHLKRHMLLHTDIKPYSCRVCGRGFAYPSELKAHEAKHENGRCHVCIECGMDFVTLIQLKRHLVAHQGPTPYECTECNKTFSYRSQLQNHMMKHQNIRPYVCTECGMEFTQPHHLKQHSLTHKGVKEFKCEVCGREFTLQANLKRHMLIHTSVRAYQCHICFKTFVQKQTLKTHMIVHSPVKPFKCKVCGKEFNRMYNLLGHMHLHSDSKPFKCPYCSSKFTLKGNLSRHMKVKHGVMDIVLDGQESLLDIGHSDHMEGQQGDIDDYEENSFDFTGGRKAADDTSDSTKMSDEESMKDIYFHFEKEAERYGMDLKP
uniref:zinc finger protein 710a isoform X1 n=1 Tax=Pristiophorus japonicus TaxID=55135 RepID=UPI00398EC318